MKMLRHRIHGRTYAYHEFMAKAEEIEVIEVPDEPVAPPAPTPALVMPPNVLDPDASHLPVAPAPKALEKMNHAELLAMATKLSGEGGPVHATMKRAELIAYIKGEDL